MKRILLLLLSVIATLTVVAQDKVSIEVAVPHRIVAGEPFSVQFVTNTNKAKEIKVSTPQGLTLLYGPAESTSTSVSIINGNMTRTSSKTFTYTYMADKEGDYVIPSASITVGKSTYQTKEKKIKVFSQSAIYGTSDSDDAGTQQARQNKSSSSAKDFFVLVSTSKKNIYEQEGFLVTFKLYALNNQFEFRDVKFPEFDSFVKQDIPMDNVRELDMEEYKGRAYYTLTLSQFLLFPQKPGQLTIPAGSFDLTIFERSEDPIFGSFGSMLGGYTKVPRTIQSAPFTIKVNPLPTPKPEDFTGAVGQFTVTEEKNLSTIKTNESYTRTLRLEGTGNLRLVELPEMEFPEGFESYDPKDDEEITTTASGEKGWKTRQYFAVPRFKGDYVLPEIRFSYFDTAKGTYQTITLPEQQVHVDQGKGTPETSSVSNYNKEEVKILNQDIRYLKSETHRTASAPMSFTTYVLWHLGLIIIGGILFFGVRARRLGGLETIENRAKKAGAMAKKYLKLAAKMRTSGDSTAYYEALLKGLDNYLSAKFHIPTSELSKEHIEAKMRAVGLPDDIIVQTLETQTELEMARYTPDGGVTQKDELYDKAAAVIDNIQSSKVKIKA